MAPSCCLSKSARFEKRGKMGRGCSCRESIAAPRDAFFPPVPRTTFLWRKSHGASAPPRSLETRGWCEGCLQKIPNLPAPTALELHPAVRSMRLGAACVVMRLILYLGAPGRRALSRLLSRPVLLVLTAFRPPPPPLPPSPFLVLLSRPTLFNARLVHTPECCTWTGRGGGSTGAYCRAPHSDLLALAADASAALACAA